MISFATQPGAVALDGSDGNSPYTKALAHTLRQPGLDIFRTFNEVALEVASATGGAQQPWFSASPIRGNFYFGGEGTAGITQPAPPPVTASPPPDPALQAWQITQNTNSEAVLEEFIRQFGGTVYAALAKARLEELRKNKVAVVAPPTTIARLGRNITVGVVGAKTGPLAPGAAVTHFPPYQLWAHEVNERGGLRLKDGMHKIELIEYDDRTQPPEAIKAVERLATVDKVDWIGGVYATGFNLAVAPTFAKYGYPQLAESVITDQGPALIKRYPGIFMMQGSTTAYAGGVVGVLKQLRDSGRIGKKVAMVNVGDDFGIELANAARPLLRDAGFDIVYDRSYPLGTQDYAPIISAAQAAHPDVFIAWSYPPDTFGLTQQARTANFSVKAFCLGVGAAFRGFHEAYGTAAENVIGLGGIADTPAIRDFYRRHKEVTNVDADYWLSPFYYSMLQILTQAIEGVGSIDRKAIAEYIRTHRFQTLVGDVGMHDQMVDKFYTVGQWQNGYFTAVNAVGFAGLPQVKLKTSW